jgi:hypothetical protein
MSGVRPNIDAASAWRRRRAGGGRVHLVRGRDKTCPVSTGGGSRRVRLVRPLYRHTAAPARAAQGAGRGARGAGRGARGAAGGGWARAAAPPRRSSRTTAQSPAGARRARQLFPRVNSSRGIRRESGRARSPAHACWWDGAGPGGSGRRPAREGGASVAGRVERIALVWFRLVCSAPVWRTTADRSQEQGGVALGVGSAGARARSGSPRRLAASRESRGTGGVRACARAESAPRARLRGLRAGFVQASCKLRARAGCGARAGRGRACLGPCPSRGALSPGAAGPARP